MKNNSLDMLYNDKIIGTISKIPIKAKHVTYLSHGMITSRIGIVILNDIFSPFTRQNSAILALSFFNLQNDGNLTMKYLQGFEPRVTTTEMLRSTSPLYIILSYEKVWVLAVVKLKELEVLIFNSLSMKCDFVVSMIDSFLNEEFGLKAEKYLFEKIMLESDVEFIDSLLAFYILKIVTEKNDALNPNEFQIPSQNFKAFKLKTLSMFTSLDPTNSSKFEKTEYMISKNDFPEYFEFNEEECHPKFETKLIHHKPKAFSDPKMISVIEYKPKKNNDIKNRDDTLEFIREEETFSLDNSMEICKDLEKLNRLNSSPLVQNSRPEPLKFSSNTSLDNIKAKSKPIKNTPFVKRVKNEEREDPPEIEDIMNEMAQDIVWEKKKLYSNSSEQIAFSKKDLKNLIVRHGVGVKYALEKERKEKEEIEEMKRQDQVKTYTKMQHINKVLWYYYLYFPEQYPLVLAQYQQQLNSKLGIDMVLPPPPGFPHVQQSPGFPQGQPPDSFSKPAGSNYFKLPAINSGEYRPDFNQSINDRNRNFDIDPNRIRSFSGYKEPTDKSLPNINNKISKISNDSINEMKKDRRKSRYASSSATLRHKEVINQTPSKNSGKIAERYGIEISKEDLRSLSLKGIITINLMDFIIQYYKEKSIYLGLQKQVKFFKTNEFNDNLLPEPKETINAYKNSSMILFFPIVVSVSKLLFGLLILRPSERKAIYYDPRNGDSSDFMKGLINKIDFKSEIENINGFKSGLFVLRFGYLVMNGRKEYNIQDNHLEGFKGRIPQLVYEIGVTNDEKGELGDFDFII